MDSCVVKEGWIKIKEMVIISLNLNKKVNNLFARHALIVWKQFQPSDGYQHEKKKMIFFDDKENSD